jgi:hypothetical protein
VGLVARQDEIRVHDLDVRGRAVEVTVDDHGRFHSTVDGKGYWASTREELYQALMKGTKRATIKVEVPFEQMFGGGEVVKRGVVTGIHAGNNSLLIRWEDGRTEQSGSGMYDVLRPLSDEERAAWQQLARVRREAAAALGAFEHERHINLRIGVRDAIEKATDEAMAAEGGEAI